MNVKQVAFALTLAVFSALCGCNGLLDNQPPKIESIQIQPLDLIALGTQVTVQAIVTDEGSGVKEVFVKTVYPDGEGQIVPMTLQAGNQFSATFTAQWNDRKLPQDYESWVVRFIVTAVDNSGNKAESGESKVRAAIGPPELPPDF